MTSYGEIKLLTLHLGMAGFGQEKKSPQETETDRGCVKLTCPKINDGVKERSYVGAVHLTTPIELVRW